MRNGLRRWHHPRRAGRQRPVAARRADDRREPARERARRRGSPGSSRRASTELVISHGNGPQVGLLALQAAAYEKVEPYPLDVLGAETEGMIGYMIEQELGNLLPFEQPFATILSMVEVDPDDPAFQIRRSRSARSTTRRRRGARAEKGWVFRPGRRPLAPRRGVAPPEADLPDPADQVAAEQGASSSAPAAAASPPCTPDGTRTLLGVEAVVDKDRASALLARELGGRPVRHGDRRRRRLPRLGQAHPAAIRRGRARGAGRPPFAAGSMGPKVEAASEFVNATGKTAAIGALADIGASSAARRARWSNRPEARRELSGCRSCDCLVDGGIL